MRAGAVIVAGGRSSRMGEEKALLSIGGKPLLTWIIARLAPQVAALALNVNGNPDRHRASELAILPDVSAKVNTPLAGIHAALRWATAEGFDAVLTVPSDCPFLPGDLVQRLKGVLPAAVAASSGKTHFLTGLWPCSLLGDLEAAINRDGLFRVKDWAARAQAKVVMWQDKPFDPFFNVNTPEDLAEANRIAAEFMA